MDTIFHAFYSSVLYKFTNNHDPRVQFAIVSMLALMGAFFSALLVKEPHKSEIIEKSLR